MLKRTSDEIEVSYLPRAGKLLSIDTSTIHYRPYERASWAKKYMDGDGVGKQKDDGEE